MSCNKLNSLKCCKCGQEITPNTGKNPTVANSYESCLRKCEKCGIGFSNAKDNPTPTIIYKNILDNIPPEAAKHYDVMKILQNSLNEHSRESKKRRFGFSTSEDAVTWTVFTYLSQKHDFLTKILNTCGIKIDQHLLSGPRVLLWGSPITSEGDNIRQDIIKVCDSLGEQPHRRSEPDVILDFGKAGLVIIEVKYKSHNDKISDGNKFSRYTEPEGIFTCPDKVKESKLYELTRNWTIGCLLAKDRPFWLVNLCLPSEFNPSSNSSSAARLNQFESGIQKMPNRAFIRLEWNTFLNNIGDKPEWLNNYIAGKILLPQ